MEDKIEVNEYVRFNNGEIGKVIDIKENPDSQEITLKLAKQRAGETGKIQLIFKTEISSFLNVRRR